MTIKKEELYRLARAWANNQQHNAPSAHAFFSNFYAFCEAVDSLYAEIASQAEAIDGLTKENEELQTLIARQPACPLDFRALVEREVRKVVKISEFQHNPVNLDCPFPDKTEAAIRAAVGAICGEGKR